MHSPSTKKHLLPGCLSSSMFLPSKIHQFHPQKFEINLNDNKYEYQGVVKTPMIDIK
jgi:5'-3' exonuclease